MTTMHDTAQRHLRAYIERLERLDADKVALAEDIKGVYAEAKSTGFDVKIMRKIIRMRKKPQSEREEEDAVLATYLSALGMAGTPLGDWMVHQGDPHAAHDREAAE